MVLVSNEMVRKQKLREMSSTMIYNPQRIFLNSLNSENGITLKEKIQNALKLMDTLKRTDNAMNISTADLKHNSTKE
jgi:hypothetical protein